MGSTGAGRFQQLTLSRQRAWWYIKTNATKDSGTVGSSTSDDQTCKTLSDRQRLDHSDERSLDKTRER